MQGSNTVTIPMSDEYEPVAAYSVDPRISSGSGTEGSYWSGVRINWTTDGTNKGITGNGWYLDDANSPFYGKGSAEDIEEAINNAGNANTYFQDWVNSGANHKQFISELPIDCWDLVSTS